MAGKVEPLKVPPLSVTVTVGVAGMTVNVSAEELLTPNVLVSDERKDRDNGITPTWQARRGSNT